MSSKTVTTWYYNEQRFSLSNCQLCYNGEKETTGINKAVSALMFVPYKATKLNKTRQ